jgi:hypothetical protein
MSTTESNELHKDVESIVHNIVGIGAAWARYGLTVGKTALETSAKTLTETARILGDVSKKFEHEPSVSTQTTPPAGGSESTTSA